MAASQPVQTNRAAGQPGHMAQVSPQVVITMLLLALYVILALFKSQSILIHGRFWAEEGTIFFAQEYGKTPLEALTYISANHGQYFLLLNVLAYLATFVPFDLAPLVTTYGALLIQALPIVIVIVARRQIALSPIYAAAFIIIVVSIPQSHETWATATNLHWHMQTLLVLLLALAPTSRLGAVLQLVGVFIGGLNGFSIVFLLPLFALQAAHGRKRRDIVLLIVALIPALLQIMIFLNNGVGTRGINSAFATNLVYGTTLQQFVGPALGLEIGDKLANIVRDSITALKPSDLPLLGTLVIIPLIGFTYLARQPARPVHILLAGSILLLIGNNLGAISGSLVSSWHAGRYFFAPSVLMFLALSSTASKPRLLRGYLTLVVIIGLLTGTSLHFSGPNWSLALREARALRLNQVTIWPGAPWTVPNVEMIDGYTPQIGQYESVDAAFAACQMDCLFVLTALEPPADGVVAALYRSSSNGLGILMTESGGAVPITADVGGVVSHTFADFTVEIDRATLQVAVNGFPVTPLGSSVHVLMLDRGQRVVTRQGF